MKLAFLTYGCKLNRYETEAIKQLLTGGSDSDPEDPDWYLLNTCTVTAKIDAEIRSKIRKIKAVPGKKVIVTGCTAQRKDAGRFLEGADFIINNEDKFDIEKYPAEVQNMAPRQASAVLRGFSDSNKAFIKIEDGCNRFCAYCEIPYVRGSGIKSRETGEVKREVENMLAAGFSEIILSGVNLGLYGQGSKDKTGLPELLAQLLKIDKHFRIRLSSIGPKEMTDELVLLAKNNPDKICPHFHMSLQSGADAVLKAMKRNYTAAEFEQRVSFIMKHIPGAALTTDLIAGFPGETQKDFEAGLRFVERMPFSRLHVFPYSDRPDAAAAGFEGKVSKAEKKRRVSVLMKIGAQKESGFAKAALGMTKTVLVEKTRKNGRLCGYTQDYIMAVFDGPDALVNKLVKVKVNEICANEAVCAVV